MKAAVLFALLAGTCNLRADREPPAEPVGVQLASGDTGCEFDLVRPATGAPAEGLWGYLDPATLHRVAAMIGPVGSAAGATRVTRPVETLETGAGADTIRHASDTASVHLEFIPPFSRPAAVYSVGRLVRLVSYEPCDVGRHQPLIRYLRQDEDGGIATDVLLQREARP